MAETVNTTLVGNPYWEAVEQHAAPSEWGFDAGALQIGYEHGGPVRRDTVKQFSWTITDPETVDFIAEHAGPRLIDPLAGTGYLAALLDARGVDVIATDLHPCSEDNVWHRDSPLWLPVLAADAVDAVTVHGSDRTLLLSWPPYGEPIGTEVLATYPGDRVIYIGEGDGGCCGDDEMFAALNTGWTEVVNHRPVQWDGMHDFVTVYERSASRLAVPDGEATS